MNVLSCTGLSSRQLRELRRLSPLLRSLFRELPASVPVHPDIREAEGSTLVSQVNARVLHLNRDVGARADRFPRQLEHAVVRLRPRNRQRRLSLARTDDTELLLHLSRHVPLVCISIGEEKHRAGQSDGERQRIRQPLPANTDQPAQRHHIRRVQVSRLRRSSMGMCAVAFRNIYAVSKPLLGLILLNENQFFTDIKQQLLFGHTQAKQAVLSTALDKLMTGIDRNLTQVNKEHFTQNITQFRNDIQDSLRGTLMTTSDRASLSSSVTLSSSFLSSASTVASTMPVTIAISTLIPSSSAAAPVEELMTL